MLSTVGIPRPATVVNAARSFFGALSAGEHAGTVTRAYRVPNALPAWFRPSKSDWYLPSKDELSQLYLQRSIINNVLNQLYLQPASSNNFRVAEYWSSSEKDSSKAWLHRFENDEVSAGAYEREKKNPGFSPNVGVFPIRAGASPSPTPSPTSDSYEIGETGPGGGKIFYYSEAGFNCGSTFSATGSPTGGKCHYLEAAPRTWSGGTTDPEISWATDTDPSADGYGNQRVAVLGARETVVGSGYKNSLAIVAQTGNVAATSAAVAARAYRGGSKSDWYLPSIDELIELREEQEAADASGGYWSSSEGASDGAYDLGFMGGPPGLAQPGKQQTTPVRPIRAF